MRALFSPKPSCHGFGFRGQLRASSSLWPVRASSIVHTSLGCSSNIISTWLVVAIRFIQILHDHATRSEANRNGGTTPLLSSALISAGANGCAVWGRMEKSQSLVRWVRWQLRRSNLLYWVASSSTKSRLFVFGFVWIRSEALVPYAGSKFV